MTKSLKSAGLAALSFAISTGVLAVALAPATASASNTSPDLQVTAQRDRDVMTQRISIADLDLSKRSDLRTLDSRLRRASVAVCGDAGIERLTLDATRCRVGAKRSADLQVAGLRAKAEALAAAGLPSRIATTIVVAAR